MLGFAYYMLKKNVLLLNGKPISNLNTKVRFSDTQYGYGDSYSGDVNLLLYGKNDLNQVSSILSASDLSSLKQIYNQQSFNELLNGTIDSCLLYTSDAADEEDSVDLGGRRIIKKKKKKKQTK